MTNRDHRPITVLMNALSARQGGGQTYITNILEHLPRDKVSKLYILAPEELALPTRDSRIERVPVKWPTGNPFARAIWEKLRLPVLVSRLKADILFCPGGLIGCRTSRNCRTVTMFRNMIPFDQTQMRRYGSRYMRLRNLLLQRAFLDSMQRADLVIFVSAYGRAKIESLISGQFRNAITIPHGLAQAFNRNLSPRVSAACPALTETGYLLYVSTLDYYKAQLEVVKAYSLLKAYRPSVEKLVLVGPENPQYGDRVRREVANLRLQDSVVITGALPPADMPGIYRNAAINIFASECENCPNILIEALAAGRPVLCSHCPPMPEFGGDAPVYFDPRSPDDLARKLASLLGDPNRMSELAAKAENRSRFYNWESCAEKTWQSIYQLAFS